MSYENLEEMPVKEGQVVDDLPSNWEEEQEPAKLVTQLESSLAILRRSVILLEWISYPEYVTRVDSKLRERIDKEVERIWDEIEEVQELLDEHGDN